MCSFVCILLQGIAFFALALTYLFHFLSSLNYRTRIYTILT